MKVQLGCCCSMPSHRKKQIIQTAQKRQRRGRIFLVLLVIVITIVGIGVYVYVSSRPAASSNGLPNIVYAKLNTTQGMIEIELYHGLTPKTVENFVNLANTGFYNNLVWNRIHPSFVIQTGNPNTRNDSPNSTWSQPYSAQSVPFEYAPSLHNAAGYVGMASTAVGVGGDTQFYINIVDNSAPLDGNYAVFAKVIVGMNVVNTLGNLPIYTPPDGQPINPSQAMLISVTISDSP
jgi:cyclophilin family peptidyl-prolyl cis-trans isomerase